jgi:peptidoglycan/LPS O-acetylase OafA/YrhL
VIYAGGGAIGRPDTAIGNGSLWTIWRQVQFYILTPLIFKFFKKLRVFVQGIFLLLFVAVNLWTPAILSALSGSMRSIYGISCLPYLYMYLLGCFVYLHKDRFVPLLCKMLPFTIILYGLVHWGIDLDHRFDWHYINPISAVLVIMVMFGAAYRFGKRRLRIDISYGIYLWHMAVLDILITVFGLQKSSILLFAATVFITIIMAIFSAELVEKPVMKLVKK